MLIGAFKITSWKVLPLLPGSKTFKVHEKGSFIYLFLIDFSDKIFL